MRPLTVDFKELLSKGNKILAFRGRWRLEHCAAKGSLGYSVKPSLRRKKKKTERRKREKARKKEGRPVKTGVGGQERGGRETGEK